MRAASYGGGGASTAREDQDSARERGKQGGMGYRAWLEALGRAYRDGGAANRLDIFGFTSVAQDDCEGGVPGGVGLALGIGGEGSVTRLRYLRG